MLGKRRINFAYFMMRTLYIVGFINLLPFQMLGMTRDSLAVPGFGYLKLYKAEQTTTHVIICISGDGGWNSGIEKIALHLKNPNTLLIGVDIRPVQRSMNKSTEQCVYPAADFERMSQVVQKKLGNKSYTIPVLLGYSSGATLVYGLLAQAPQNTFMGGIVMGFCPDIAILKPLCKGSGTFTCLKRKDGKGWDLGPERKLSAPFVSLQGMMDKVCDYKSAIAFFKNVPAAQVISLPLVGHGYGTEKDWLPQLTKSYSDMVILNDKTMPVQQELNLPLHLTPAQKGKSDDRMIFFISGDGGWTSFDQQIVNAFAARGIPSVGLNSLKYFWEQKSPEQLSSDMFKVINHYGELWTKSQIVLMGYSFGADVIPFAYNRLPEAFKINVKGLGLLSPSNYTDFEIHISDLLNFGPSDRERSVIAELNKLEGIKPICFFGKKEKDLPVKLFSSQKTRMVYLEGGHHYDNSFEHIADEMLSRTGR